MTGVRGRVLAVPDLMRIQFDTVCLTDGVDVAKCQGYIAVLIHKHKIDALSISITVSPASLVYSGHVHSVNCIFNDDP